jgi:hypothetical protein
MPVLMFQPERDEILPNAFNGEVIRDSLPRQPDFHLVPGGHFVFVQPCSTKLAAEVPRVCTDPPGVDRGSIQQRTNTQIAEFLMRALNVKDTSTMRQISEK